MSPVRAVIRPNAQILDARSAARRTLCLQVSAHASSDVTAALIHNLSETGLLLETSADLQVGEMLQVDLPHAGATTALVIWNRDRFVGCEFASPVSRAAMSAALLRNPVFPGPQSQTVPVADIAPEYDNIPLESEEQGPGQTILMFSLLLSLAIVLAFVVALLSFPFSS